MIYIRIFCGFWNKYRNCAFEIFCGVLVYIPWHRPLLAQPGPWREAIHCALLSSFICASILIATCLLLAASLAAGVIRPTLAKVHMACALTASDYVICARPLLGMEAPGYKWVMGVTGEIMINVLTYSVLSQLLYLSLRVFVAF